MCGPRTVPPGVCLGTVRQKSICLAAVCEECSFPVHAERP